MENLKKYLERLFRKYYKYCNQKDIDSLNDIFDKTLEKDNFFDINEFIALRNLGHHKEDIQNEYHILPLSTDKFQIISDLPYLCLIKKLSLDKAIQDIKEKYREKEREKINEVLHTYGQVVNINLCIFNFMVKVYEKMEKHNIKLEDENYFQFKADYEYETESEISHFVNGHINILAHPAYMEEAQNTLLEFLRKNCE